MMRRPALFAAAALAACSALTPPAMAEPVTVAAAPADGVLRQQSAHGFDETIRRLRADIAGKGIPVFAEIDQARLASGAHLDIRRSTLILFGNPPLGVQFIQSNPYSALDWPVRMLVLEDEAGQVWVAWTDFDWIAKRYGITDRKAQFRMASEVASSIASSVNR